MPPINQIILIAVEASLTAMRAEIGNIPFEPAEKVHVNLNQTMDSFAQDIEPLETAHVNLNDQTMNSFAQDNER